MPTPDEHGSNASPAPSSWDKPQPMSLAPNSQLPPTKRRSRKRLSGPTSRSTHPPPLPKKKHHLKHILKKTTFVTTFLLAGKTHTLERGTPNLWMKEVQMFRLTRAHSLYSLEARSISEGSKITGKWHYRSSSTSSKIAFLFEPRIIRDVTVGFIPWCQGCMNCQKSRDKPPTNRCVIWSTEVTIASLLLWHHLLRLLWPCRKHPGDV